MPALLRPARAAPPAPPHSVAPPLDGVRYTAPRPALTLSLLSRCGAACHRVGRLAACAVQKDIQCLSVCLFRMIDVMDAAISNEIIYHEASKFHDKVA
jgi:hypothetical protein